MSTFDPKEIARQAAEHIRLNNEMVRGGYDTPHTTESIILSAAAKMVQQSGAVAALERHTHKDYKTGCVTLDAEVLAALQSLRSITGEAQQGDS